MMNKMIIECFEKESEMVSFYPGVGCLISLTFTEPTEGYISIDYKTEKIIDNSCLIDLTRFPDGEHTPVLTTEDRLILLPSITKEGNKIIPTDYQIVFMRKLSLHQKRSELRLQNLEKRIEEIEKKITGRTIF